MTPKATLQAAFKERVTPELITMGSRFVESQFAYKRDSSQFTQEISIILSHTNSQNSIQFWSAFNVSSSAYLRSLKEQGRETPTGYLGNSMDWNIPGWRADGDHSTSFILSPSGDYRRILADWLRRCQSVGIPYLGRLSSWEGLADDLLRQGHDWDRAADFYELAGKPELAVKALEVGIVTLNSRDFTFSDAAHPTLASKKTKQAAERDSKVILFRDRITSIKDSEQAVPSDGHKPSSHASSADPTAPADAH